MNLKNNFSIVVWNAQSINNKHDTISHFLDSHQPSILAIVESHFALSIHHLSSLYNSTNPQYTCISYPHSRPNSGGTVLFIHSSVQYTLRTDLHLHPSRITSRKQPSSLHWIQLKVNSLPSPIFFGVTYIHPSRTNHDIQQLSNNIAHVHGVAHSQNASVIIAGDFNQHCNEWVNHRHHIQHHPYSSIHSSIMIYRILI